MENNAIFKNVKPENDRQTDLQNTHSRVMWDISGQ